MEVKLREVPIGEKPVLFAMMQEYIAEFSAFEPAETDRNGVYQYSQFDSYWQEGDRHPFFITVDGKNAGLILVNRNNYVRMIHKTRSIAEFYIKPEYRRMGIGRAAAHLVTEGFGGWWQLMMHPKNAPSHVFWRGVFDYPGATNLRVRTGPRWYSGGRRGEVMTFKMVKR